MKATIWHNPGCGTSRNTLAALQEAGAEVTVVEYLKNPPSADKLAQLYRDAGITPQQGLRLRGTDAEERGLPVGRRRDGARRHGRRAQADRTPAGRDRQGRAPVPADG